MKIIQQTGSNCKSVSLCMVDTYYATLYDKSIIHLHKKKIKPYSMRQHVKKYGRSFQGEILTRSDLKNSAVALGYKVTSVDCSDSIDNFRQTIKQNIKKGHPLISHMAVNYTSTTDLGLPGKFDGINEHSYVISGYDEKKDEVTILHWGKSYNNIPLVDLYASLMSLPKQRQTEFYVKSKDKKSKYRACDEFGKCLFPSQENTKDGNKIYQTISPRNNSGFKGWVFCIQPKYTPSKQNKILTSSATSFIGSGIGLLSGFGICAAINAGGWGAASFVTANWGTSLTAMSALGVGTGGLGLIVILAAILLVGGAYAGYKAYTHYSNKNTMFNRERLILREGCQSRIVTSSFFSSYPEITYECSFIPSNFPGKPRSVVEV